MKGRFTFAIGVLAALVGNAAVAGHRNRTPRVDPHCVDPLLRASGNDRVIVELALQQLRYATVPGERDIATALLDAPFRRLFDTWFWRHDVDKFQDREEFCQETMLRLLKRLEHARNVDEPARDFLPSAYVIARYVWLESLQKRRPWVGGDLQWASATPEATEDTSGAVLAGRVLAETPMAPVPLSGRQLEVLRHLATGWTHAETAVELDLDIRQVHDTVGSIELKVGKRLNDAAIRRTHFQFVADLTSERRVFIEVRKGRRDVTLVAEGPLPFRRNEGKVLLRWLHGNDLVAIAEELKLDLAKTRELYLRFLYERRHDFEETFSGRETPFAQTLDLEISETEGRYVAYRAMGLAREDIMALTAMPKSTVNAWNDRLKRRLKALLEPRGITVDYRRPYYAMLGDRRDEVRIVLTTSDKQEICIRAKIVDRTSRTSRNRQALSIAVSASALEAELVRMGGWPEKALRLRLFEKLETPAIAARLDLGISSVRKFLAEATFRLGVAFGEPEMNCWNLTVKN